ncbi:immunity 26/phosphotriesterase HocA family protein [Lysobacter yananisis]|uniref:Immunity 26/phosphotriesterase HocA family protein n=1 Tax=Lysobacter yananisis TaxID=1003114 RepID=A0ABY9PF61_9GAMM|nr:immunity 26/phosphotriesterase HocA family protein [Lysobacter yananisis]WMT05688.1 immunity 26/phosphotriesterase HocA family protein [Lysobacter yananisis]
MRHKYSEGTWFAVPLRNGGFATGVVTRKSKKGGIIVAHYFGPQRDTPSTMDEVESHSAAYALIVLRSGDISIKKGLWPTIGHTPNFSIEEWPTPLFIRKQEIGGMAYAMAYDDGDVSVLLHEELVAYDENLSPDGLHGDGAVELILTSAST